MVNWYSLFSHTGKETAALANTLSGAVQLQMALTNNANCGDVLPAEMLTVLPYRKDIEQWLMTPGNVIPGSIVTLNGYMRIMSPEVLKYLHSIKCRVYNIHPAPLLVYPELKGKDPQDRLYEGLRDGWYHFIGVVIHEVDEGVDTGKIVASLTKDAPTHCTREWLYNRLHELGTELWLQFFDKEMSEHG